MEHQVQIDDNLVMYDDYADVAILSEHLYMPYYQSSDSSGERFHKDGNTTGYGDGHVTYIDDSSGSKFLAELKTNRRSNFYQTSGDAYPRLSGVWYQLDIEF
jgi:hypothetical protein